MDKLRAIEAFHAIAEHGSLTAAAGRLGRSLPTVVRALAQLERELGVRLFNRSTRRIDLTEEGALYLGQTRRLLEDLQAAEARISGREADVSGRVTIAAPIFFGERFVAELLPGITGAYPGLELRLHLSDRIEDLIQGHIDLAVRIGHLPASELVRVKIGEVRQLLCASPAALARQAAPDAPQDLARRDCIIIDGNSAGRAWPFLRPDGGTTSVEVRGGVTVNTMRAARRLCLAGEAFALLLSYQVADDLRDGRLVRLLPEHEPPPLPVQILRAAGQAAPKRVQAVQHELERHLRTALRATEARLAERSRLPPACQ